MKYHTPRRSHVAVLLTSIAALVSANEAVAQISLTTETYTEAFSIGTSTTATLPSGYKMTIAGDTSVSWLDGTNVAAVTQASSTGSPTAGGRYNWGNNADTTDRAIGFMTSGSYLEPNSILAAFTNDTGNTISSILLSFDLERYRINTASLTNNLYFSLDGSTWGSSLDAYAWNTGASVYDFTPTIAEGSVQQRSLTIPALSIGAGATFYLRWEFDASASTNSQGVGLDNVAFTLSYAASALYWDPNGPTPGTGGTGDWDTASANWSNSPDGNVVPTTFVSASPVIFGGTPGAVTITGTGVTATAGLKFESAGYVIDGSSLTLNTSATINTDHAAETLTTISVPISGNAGLTKAGAGRLLLTAANDFSGTVNLTGGTLEVSSAANLGANTNAITFGGGVLVATDNVSLSANQNVSGAGAIEIAAGKTLSIGGNASFASLDLRGPGTLTLDGSTRSTNAITFSGAGSLDSTAGPVTATTITTTHTAGTATVGADLNLGSVLRTVTVADGSAEIDLALEGALTLAGGGASRLHKLGTGTLRLSGDNSGLSGSVRIGTAGGNPAAGGTIVINNKNSLGNATGIQIQFNDGVLRAENELISADAIPLGLSIGAGEGVPATFTGTDMEFTGTVQLFKAGGKYQHAIRVENTTMFTGNFVASTGSGESTGLTVTGPGTLILAGTSNTIAEPITLDGPKLSLFGSLTAGVTVEAGTLTGVGTIGGNSSVTAGGFLAPGADVGTLTFGGNLDISGAITSTGSGSLLFNLDTVATSDQVALTTGALTIGTGLLDFEDFAFLTAGSLLPGEYTLFATTQPIDGTFGSLEGTVGGITSNIALSPDGTDIVLNVVPEPGTATLLLGGLGLMAARRRRR